MKKLLLLALLAGCTSVPAEDPTHKAISDILRRSMDDPASYQPVGWSKPEPWTIGDSISALRHSLSGQQHLTNLRIKTDSIFYATHIEHQSHTGKFEKGAIQDAKQRLVKFRRERDSVRVVIASLPIKVDTTQLYYYIVHSFRAKNRMGALVLDSVGFYVAKNGRITTH